jgi:hypothetical protein
MKPAGYGLHRLRLLADETESIQRKLYKCGDGQSISLVIEYRQGLGREPEPRFVPVS